MSWTPPAEIVGVVADSRADGIDQAPMHTMFQPDTQSFAPSTLLVRTAGAPDRLAPHVIETIRQLDPNRPIDHVQTLEEIRDETIAPQRLNATLIGLFAALALAIATVGVAGVLAFSVSQRTNELGIRLALGAERGTILRMILGEGAAMALVGLAVGGVAAVPLSRLLERAALRHRAGGSADDRAGRGPARRRRARRRMGSGAARDGGRSDRGASRRLSVTDWFLSNASLSDPPEFVGQQHDHDRIAGQSRDVVHLQLRGIKTDGWRRCI